MPGVKISELVTDNIYAGDIVPLQRGTLNYGGRIGDQIATLVSDISALSAIDRSVIDTTLSIKIDEANLYSNLSGSIIFDNNGGTTVGRVLYDETSNTFNIGHGANNHITINSAGNVGIGTTTPTEKLDVAGSINIDATGSYKKNGTKDLGSSTP